MELAARLGRLAHHCRNGRLCSGYPGFPDTVIVGACGLLLAELKMPGRGLESDQITWKYTLLAVGIAYYIWQPIDLASGLVECHIRAST